MWSLAPSPATPRRRGGQAGFTLLELMIVVAILGIIASIGVPQYVSALRIARVAKAKQELMTIATAVDMYTVNNGGQLPLTLYQVGYGGRRDPWGVPYCYLNYGDGTGDGLQWAIDAGLVDPSAVHTTEAASVSASSAVSPGNSGNAGNSGVGGGPRRGGFGFPWVTLPRFQRPAAAALEAAGATANARSAVARALAGAVTTSVAREVSEAEVSALAASLAAVGSPTIFAGVSTEVTRRRDRYMFPLNTDYDLFSLGPNAQTTVSLGESLGQDDVIRANNGGFFGTASEY